MLCTVAISTVFSMFANDTHCKFLIKGMYHICFVRCLLLIQIYFNSDRTEMYLTHASVPRFNPFHLFVTSPTFFLYKCVTQKKVRTIKNKFWRPHRVPPWSPKTPWSSDCAKEELALNDVKKTKLLRFSQGYHFSL